MYTNAHIRHEDIAHVCLNHTTEVSLLAGINIAHSRNPGLHPATRPTRNPAKGCLHPLRADLTHSACFRKGSHVTRSLKYLSTGFVEVETYR